MSVDFNTCVQKDIKVEKFIFTWTVEKFSIWYKDMSHLREELISPKFSSDDNNKVKWHLSLNIVNEQNLALYVNFSPLSEASTVKAKFKFSIVNAKGEEENVRTSTKVCRFHAQQRFWGYNDFISTDILLKKIKRLLPNDELTIVCEIEEVNIVNISDETIRTRSKMIEDKLSKDIGNLFVNENCSDVTLVVGRHELKAHKSILSARSDVFAAMFKHDMVESMLNRVVITDIDHEVLKEMLNFMYTGKAPNLNKMAQGLLAAADKYALEGLKVICEEALSVNLTPENAVEMLILADLHSAGQLEAQTTAFIKTWNRLIANQFWGFGDFISTDILLNNADNLLPNDELTIVCEIEEVNIIDIYDESKKIKSKMIEDELSKDLGNLFLNGKCSDVTLAVVLSAKRFISILLIFLLLLNKLLVNGHLVIQASEACGNLKGRSNTMASLPAENNVGHTEVKVDKSVFTWTIGNFNIWCNDMGECRETLLSPTFSSGTNNKLKWYLKLDIVDGKQLSLFLHCETLSVKAKFKFSILNVKKEEEYVRRSEMHDFGQKFSAWGYKLFICLDILLKQAYDLLPDGKLTIVCEISEVDLVNISNTINQPKIVQSKVTEDKLSGDFDNLFTNHQFSDVTFAVGEHEIKAHKTILAARSNVFAAMFEHEMKESTLNRVVITDIDHEVLNEMLKFMYTGKAPNLYELTYGLLAAADKYALEDLKEMCENALNVTLSVETATQTLVSADLHTAAQLKAQSIAFIKTHVTDVMQTQGWQDAIRTHPDLIAEYALEDLKEMCENALNVTLSFETATQTLVSADLHTAAQLKAQSIAFIKTHVTDVMQTQGWQDAITTQPDLIAEVLRAFAKQINL
uniref:BTB domain-containing protein n=1 Tax=Glossina pallidipes TaxID=7398 RepID=A0A1A9ZZW1_GLOPL